MQLDFGKVLVVIDTNDWENPISRVFCDCFYPCVDVGS